MVRGTRSTSMKYCRNEGPRKYGLPNVLRSCLLTLTLQTMARQAWIEALYMR